MFCPKCGNSLKDGAQFCGACGSPVTQRANGDAVQNNVSTAQRANTDAAQNNAPNAPTVQSVAGGTGGGGHAMVVALSVLAALLVAAVVFVVVRSSATQSEEREGATTEAHDAGPSAQDDRSQTTKEKEKAEEKTQQKESTTTQSTAAEPKQEEIKQEEPKQEAPKQETPAPASSATEEPKKEEPKQEEPAREVLIQGEGWVVYTPDCWLGKVHVEEGVPADGGTQWDIVINDPQQENYDPTSYSSSSRRWGAVASVVQKDGALDEYELGTAGPGPWRIESEEAVFNTGQRAPVIGYGVSAESTVALGSDRKLRLQSMNDVQLMPSTSGEQADNARAKELRSLCGGTNQNELVNCVVELARNTAIG